jgi:S-adenosylmethionine decarboxylase proenzyme
MIGNHIIVDIHEIPNEIFLKMARDNYTSLHQCISMSLKQNGMNLINYSIKDFENPPGAFTSLYLLSESHLSLHSWPELSYIALDCFTCGPCDTNKVVEDILLYLNPKKINKKIIIRGETILS